MKIRIIFIILAASLFFGCASIRVAYKKDYDFSAIRVVKIGNFTSSARQPNSGAVIANEFIRQLLSAGYIVKATDGDSADVILEGNVTEYLPNNRYLIQSNTQNGAAKEVVIVNQPVELSGTSAYNIGTTFGLGENDRVVVSNATVGVAAYLKDTATGDVIWSNAYSYEGLDITTAMEGTVRYLLHSWPSQK